MRAENLFSNIPSKIPEELFDVLISKGDVKIERIVSYGHRTPNSKWYDQDRDEFVVLLSGEAVLSFEGAEELKLFAGDSINIPAHQKHRVEWTKPDTQTIWLAIYY
ncbi:MAG: cupin 2 protein [Campylobacterota bacterium]|nr:cupin 2 protein [Campylobacterota bacterium]